MQVFKREAFRRFASAATLLIMIAATYSIISYNLADITYRDYFVKDIEKIKEDNATVDMVFVGASRVYQSMVPSVFEEKLGYQNVLVAATATQPICGTYFYIKQIISDVHPKKIVIDVTWDRLLNENTIQPCLLVYDRLSFLNRVEYVLQCIEKKDYKYLLGPARYKDNFLMLSILHEERKAINLQEEGICDPKEDYYAGKGFVYSLVSCNTGNIPIYGTSKSIYSDEKIISSNKEYLDRCIDLCKKNGVDVELVTAPSSLSYMYSVENYDEAVKWYRDYAESKGIVYHNLSLLKNREELLPDEMMMDYCHTNGKGAEIVSNIYADILLNDENGTDSDYMFYSNMEELGADVHRVVSVRGILVFEEDSDEQDGYYPATITLCNYANKSDEVYYSIELRLPGGDFEVISEWSKEEIRSLQLPCNSDFDIRVTAKNQNEGDLEAYQIYSY